MFAFYFNVEQTNSKSQTALTTLPPPFVTLSLFSSISELRGSIWKVTKGRWKVTRVVTKGELGRPVERLREQMGKLQLHSSNRALTRSEGKAVILEQQMAIAEEGEKAGEKGTCS